MKKFWFGLILVIIGCQPRQNKNENDGGIIFSFDDQYIDEWYDFKDTFKKYNIKATFFINRPQNLTSDQINKLKQLSYDGHEIGCHGLNHINVSEFKNETEQYYIQEVKPASEILKNYGFEIESFAYPFGDSTEQIDSILMNYISVIRKAMWNFNDTTLDYYNDIYATNQVFRNVNSMGIDNNYNISLSNLELGFIRAKKNNEVLILHSHRIKNTSDNYTVTPEYLENAFILVKKYNLKSVRMCDLKNFFNE